MKIKILFLVVFFFGVSNVAQAQNSSPELSQVRSQFTISLLNNFGHTRYQQEFGAIANLDRMNSGHTLLFKYRYNFSQKFYAETAWGVGAHIENHQPPMYDLGGFDFWHYHAFMHSRVEVSAAYQIYAHNRNSLNAKLGIGWNRFAAVGLGTGYGTDGERFNASYDVQGNRLPFFTLGMEYAIPTKRMDEFAVYLGYQHAFNSFYRGFYEYIVGESLIGRGTSSSNLRGLQLGVSYTFTRHKRKEKIAEIIQSGEVEVKEAKRKSRFERRAIDPQSRFLTLGLGSGTNRTKFTPKNDPFFGSGDFSFQHRLSYEHGWKNNLFFEFDYYGFSLWQSQFIRIDKWSSSGSMGSAFYGHFLSAGVNYKIQNPGTNFQFFNVHAGLGLGANFDRTGPAGMGGGSMMSDNYWYDYSYTSEVRGRLMPVVYTGISKDIRITERMLLNLAYRHQFGFLNVYKSEFLYSDSNNPEPRKLHSSIDGTAFFLQIGLKYRIR